jgi:alkanesulfonate monooxygenase SsuD/methylene tetrahydromethanopterin reductase-like flavin-dependent oxidoreductase (luciferase family)
MNFGFLTECYVREGKSHTAAFDDTFEQIAAAEALGLDSVWIVEQHFRPWASILPSPMVMAAAVAARTSRMRIGLAVQVLPLTNPLRVAEEAVMIDHISHGRFDLGVGRSGITKFYDGYNVPYSESRLRFDESLEIILAAFRQETFSFEGQFHSFRDVTLSPKPLQQPHPPIWVATSNPEAFPVLGQRGFPLLLWYQGASFEEPVRAYRRAWDAAGHGREPQVLLRIPTYVGEDDEKGADEPRESTLYDLRRVARENRQAGEIARAERAEGLIANYDEVLRTRVAYGSAARVADRLREFIDCTGVTGFLLDFNFGGQIPQPLVLESMRRLANHVMPALH